MKFAPLLQLFVFAFWSSNAGSIAADSEAARSGESGPILTVEIDQSAKGFPTPFAFQGLSYETSLLSTNFLTTGNTVLIQLIKNLGGGVLRIGGNMSDEMAWTGAARTAETPDKSITTTDVDNLAAFSRSIGWPVLFGLNLGAYHPELAANEAEYVSNILKTDLLALQFGNEPDGYHSWNPKRSKTYGYAEYRSEWEKYFGAVRNRLPNVPLAGPDVAYRSEWVKAFAADLGKNVILLDGHYYQNGPASNPAINIDSLFTPIPQYANYFKVINDASVSANVPWRISECNSINGGGKAGVSDTFASALWALDFMWTVAVNHGQGVNFHGGKGGAYSPFAIAGKTVMARPEYYAMLAFKAGSEGRAIFVPQVAPSKYQYSAYAASGAGSTAITVINKERTQDLTLKFNLTKDASTYRVARLSAPSMDAAKGVTFSNSTVNADGTFVPGKLEGTPLDGAKTFTIKVPAASAAVVTVE